MSKDIKILIAAKDEASHKLRAVAKESSTLDKTVGKLSAAKLIFDVTGLGQFSQAIGAAEQGVSSLANAQAGGAKSALAYTAALAGVAAVTGFKIGQMLSGVAADQKLLNDETTRAIVLEQQRQKVLALRANSRSSSEAKNNPNNREAEITAARGDVGSLKEELAELEAKWGSSFGRGSAMIKMVSEQLETARARVADLDFNEVSEKKNAAAEAAARVQKAGEEADKIAFDTANRMRDALRDEIVEMKHGSKQAQILALDRAGVDEAYQKEIASLIDLRDALKKKADAEKEDAKLQKELQKEKEVSLDKLAKSQKAIKEEQKEVADEERDKIRKAQSGTEKLEGTESRFGIRGHVSAPVDPVHEDNKKLIKLNEENRTLQKEHEKLLQKIADNTKTIDSTVGV